MKKLGLFRKCGITAMIAVLCMAMVITCFTFVAPTSAARADSSVGTNGKTLAENISVDSECDYGKSFTVPAAAAGATVTVTAPDGTTVAPESNAVVAKQIGNYKVTYASDNGVKYDYYVKVRLNEDYFLKVEHDGADIPSYMSSADGGQEITLPRADVVYYNEDKILCRYPGNAYTVKVTDSRGGEYDVNSENTTTNKFKATQNGKVFITYTAEVAGGSKHFSRTFTINVQSSAPSGGNPTLSVSGVQKDASINRAVTLPKATATDDNDDNVKVVISVIGPDLKEVTNVDIDDNGYAYKKDGVTYDKVIFDNDQAMTFYPTVAGQYKVTYTAYNDSYTDNGSVGRSSTREYYINVSDLVAPVFKSVKDYSIPETWGMEVKKASADSDDGEVIDNGGKITFYVPEVVDNKDHMYAEDDNDKDLISVYFRIYDSDKNKNVIEFTNILADDDDAASKFTKNDVYTEDAVFSTETGFTFDFNKYARKDGENAATKPGTYTVLYRARDKANNTSSKSYTITLNDTYTDKSAPTTAKVTVADYMSTADDEFTVPYPEYADGEDTRPQVDYRIYSGGKYVEVKGGETAEFVQEEGKDYLVIDEKDKLEIADKLYYYVGVTDKAGNFKSNAEDINLLTSETADDYKKIAAVTEIVKQTSVTPSYVSGIEFTNASVNKQASDTIVAGDKVCAGSFVIETDKELRNYTGFEVSVYDPKYNALNVSLETLSTVSGDNARIYVQNICFNATVGAEGDDTYKIVIRVFDVNGKSSVYGYTLGNVQPPKTSGNVTSAISNIDVSGNVNVKYKLHNDIIENFPSGPDDGDDAEYRVVRKIAGGIFAVMGSEFTAKTTGNFDITDGYIATKHIGANTFDYSKAGFAGGNGGAYSVNVVDDSSPVIELQTVMPTYWAKYDSTNADTIAKTTVKLPRAVAYTENGIAEVTVSVKDKNGSTVKFDKDNYTFKGTVDGTYTVTYTATSANAKEERAEYFINIGDVEAPPFKLTGGGTTANITAKVGDKFKFQKMELLDLDEASDVQITKKIIDPSLEEVSGATVNGSYNSNKDKLNNGTDIVFSMAGTYKVEYTARDAVGNEYVTSYNITVVSSGSGTPTTWTTLSTVLIVVAIVLLAGVIIYVVRFRKVKR